MKKKITCILICILLIFTSFSVVPVVSASEYSVDVTVSSNWICGGSVPDSNVFSNDWGTYIFDNKGATVICSDKGYTNIMYEFKNVDFDKFKGIFFSVDSVSANWDIKIRKGDGSDISYSGYWNGLSADCEYAFYDFSNLGWFGTDDLKVFFYAIGPKDSYARLTYLHLADYTYIKSEGYILNTANYSLWETHGIDITESEGIAENGEYKFEDTGVTIKCKQNTLFYYAVSKTLDNVDFDAIKGLSYNISALNNNRWDIKIFNLDNNQYVAHASGGVWNGIAGSKSGFVDFRNADWSGIGRLKVELYVIGDNNSATFNDLTFINLGAQDTSLDVTDYSKWNVNSANASDLDGSYAFNEDGLTVNVNGGNEKYRYAVSSNKIYLNCDENKIFSYIVSANNSRWMIEITNTTLDQTVQINPTWAGSHGSKSGYYDLSDLNWQGFANIIVTVYAIGLGSNGSIAVRSLEFSSDASGEPPLLALYDRPDGDITGEGAVDVSDLVKALNNQGTGKETYSPSEIKSQILEGEFFDNPSHKYDIPENTVLKIDTSKYNEFQKTLVTAVQGIVNRSGPKVFLETGTYSYLNRYDLCEYGESAYPEGFLVKYISKGTDAFWLDEISRIYGFDVIDIPVEAVIEIYSDLFNGVIEYDEKSYDDSGNVISSVSRTNSAATYAGVYSALPMTVSLKNRYNSTRNLKTSFDIRGRFSSRLESTQWAVDNLLQYCSDEFVSSYFYEGENGTLQNDYAIMNKAFCYDLPAILQENKDHVFSDGNVDESLYNPDEEAALNTILSHIKDYGFVWGWGAGGENGQASAPAIHGLELVCANMPNASFFAGLEVKRTNYEQPNRTENEEIKVENKFYISFMMNEGDSYKAMANLYAGAWNQKSRGNFPISWGVDALVLDLFPFFADYYYNNSSENDYYFAASSGYGYIHPYYLPVDMQDGYAEKVKTGCEKYGLDYVDIWWFNMTDANGNSNKWDWLEKTGLKGLTQWTSFNETKIENGIPVVYSELYYPSTTIWTDVGYKERAEKLAQSLIKAQATIPNQPFCTVIYAGEPQYFQDIVDCLPEDKFEIVSLDKLFKIIEKSKDDLVNKRVEYDF